MKRFWLLALAFVLLFSMSASAFAALVDPRAPYEGETYMPGDEGETWTFVDCDEEPFKRDLDEGWVGEFTQDGITVTVYLNDDGKTEFNFSSTTKMVMKVAVKGGSATYPYPPMPWGEPLAAILGQWIYDYTPGGVMSDTGLRAPNVSGAEDANQADLSNIVFCFETRDVLYGAISAEKWYDRDKDGEWDGDEPPLAGWKINLTDGVDTWCALTDADGAVTFPNLLPGTYWVSEEVAPAGSGWVQTFPEGNEYEIELAEGETKGGYLFGNVCEATSAGGYTLGYWSNKNGEANLKAYGNWQGILTPYNLVDAKGNAFNPANYAGFRSWLLKADATNISYMLSVQMAATLLNQEVMGADYDGMGVIVDGVWVSIDDLIVMSDAFLAANPVTVESGDARKTAEFYKNIFDGLNNNMQKIIPFDPCPVPVWTCE